MKHKKTTECMHENLTTAFSSNGDRLKICKLCKETIHKTAHVRVSCVKCNKHFITPILAEGNFRVTCDNCETLKDDRKSCGHLPCQGVCGGAECRDDLGYTIICDGKSSVSPCKAPPEPVEEWELTPLEDEWREFHCELYLPGSAINTNTIFDWWDKKLKSLLAQEREKQKKKDAELVDIIRWPKRKESNLYGYGQREMTYDVTRVMFDEAAERLKKHILSDNYDNL